MAATVLAACGAQSAQQDAPMVMATKLQLSGKINGLATAVTDVTSVAVTLDGAPLAGSPFTVTAGRFGPLTIDATPGVHAVAASASAGASTFTASSSVNVTYGGPNSVTLYLFDTQERQQFQTVPVVVAVGANPSTLVVTSGSPLPASSVTSKTVDFDASTSVSLLWTDSCGGAFSDNTAANPTYTPAAFAGLNTRVCTLTLTATGNTPNGPVSDPLFSVGTLSVTVTYVAPLAVDGYVVTAPAFTDANLIFDGTNVCPLAWLSNANGSDVALSADACDSQLHGAIYPPGRPIAFQAMFAPPPGAVTVSASGVAECDGYGQYSAAGSVGAGNDSATFVWPAGTVTVDAACKMTVTVAFVSPGTSTPDRVSSSLPVSFRFHAPQVVFNNLPTAIPPNLPSQPFQAQQTFEFGDYVQLAGTARHAGFATVLMSNWAPHSQWPLVGDATGFDHPITMNIYDVDLVTTPGTPKIGALVGTVTQTVHIPWRPEADATCADPTRWRASNGNCYGGAVSAITIDLTGIATLLPDSIIYGIAYNTMSYGANPIGVDGPYDSLNVAVIGDGSTIASTLPSVGADVDPTAVFWNTITAAWYADGGAGGVGIFRQDTGWTGYAPAVQFQAY